MSAKFPRGGGGANPFSAIRLLHNTFSTFFSGDSVVADSLFIAAPLFVFFCFVWSLFFVQFFVLFLEKKVMVALL